MAVLASQIHCKFCSTIAELLGKILLQTSWPRDKDREIEKEIEFSITFFCFKK